MAVLVCLQPDSRAAARVTSALGDDHVLLHCTRWGKLLEILSERPLDGCVVDLDHPDHPVRLDDLRHLRHEYPTLAIVIFTAFHGREMDLFRLGQLGVDGVILAGHGDDRVGIRRTVATALTSALTSLVAQALQGRVRPVGIQCVMWAIEHAHRNPEVRELADELSLRPRTLNRRLAESHLVSASIILMWGKLLRAGRLFTEPTATVENVAFRLGYSSGAALSRAFRRRTGYPASEAVRRGGLGFVLDAFLTKGVRDGAKRRRGRWSILSSTLNPYR